MVTLQLFFQSGRPKDLSAPLEHLPPRRTKKMVTLQLFFQSVRAKDLSAPLEHLPPRRTKKW